MSEQTAVSPRRPHFWRHVLIGLFTVAPLWVTWLVLDFLLGLLARVGAPGLKAAAGALRPLSEGLADWLLAPAVQYVLAVALTLAGLYGIGLLASFVVGRKLIDYLERLVMRLPLVETIYNATKRFLQNLRKPPGGGQRVVLISFPTPEMKAVGFLTRVLKDSETGRELAAVYVPTAPNPTSGYIEIVPMEDVVATDWSMEEAMTFVVTGGTNSPPSIRFGASPGAPAARGNGER